MQYSHFVVDAVYSFGFVFSFAPKIGSFPISCVDGISFCQLNAFVRWHFHLLGTVVSVLKRRIRFTVLFPCSRSRSVCPWFMCLLCIGPCISMAVYVYDFTTFRYWNEKKKHRRASSIVFQCSSDEDGHVEIVKFY